MKFISLFTGIGGFDLGFERAGMQCVAQVEFDKRAREVLRKHWPDVALHEDVRNVGKHNLPTVDLVCGGFPCQDLSVAGKRKGLDGERSGLWFEFHRIIGELKPRWVVIENVPGLLTSNRGRDFAVILDGLVKCGYRVAWRVLDAQYFGLAQRRKRVFIVASLGNGRAAEVLFERESGNGNTPPRRATPEAATTTVIKGAAIGRKPENGPRYGEILTDNSCYTLTTNEVHAVATQAFTEAGFERWVESSVTSTLSAHSAKEAHDLIALTGWDYQGRNIYSLHGISPTLSAGGNSPHSSGDTHINVMVDNQHTPLGFTWHTANRMSIGENLSPTLTVSDHTPMGVQDTPLTVRRLTPRECERLQGFPDDWTAGQPDSARYKQCGNAVAVPVLEWIGKRIVNAETEAA